MGKEEISVFPTLTEIVLGLPEVAPNSMAAFQGEIQKDSRPFSTSSPSLAILLAQILRHPCYQSSLPLHTSLGPSGSQQSGMEAVSSLHHYTHDVKKSAQADFCQFAGQQSYIFPRALCTEACRAHAGYSILWARLFFGLCCAASLTLLTSPLLWTDQAW